MPFVHIEYSAGSIDAVQKEKLIAQVTEVVAQGLAKDPAKIYVILQEIPAENLGVGGESLARKNLKEPLRNS